MGPSGTRCRWCSSPRGYRYWRCCSQSASGRNARCGIPWDLKKRGRFHQLHRGCSAPARRYWHTAECRASDWEPANRSARDPGERARDNRDIAARQYLPELFVGAEQEHLVFLDGTSQHSSKLMTLERWGADGLVKEVAGVERAVAQIFECVSVQYVRSGGGHNVDSASSPLPILGAIGVGYEIEFPHRFHA